MNITISELQELVVYGLSEFSDDRINTNNDFYWNVLYSDMFDFPEEPSLAIGSLEDDIKHLRLFFEQSIPFGETEISRLAAMLKLFANHLDPENTLEER